MSERLSEKFRECIACDYNGNLTWVEEIRLKRGADEKLYELEDNEEKLKIDLKLVTTALANGIVLLPSKKYISPENLAYQPYDKVLAIIENQSTPRDDYDMSESINFMYVSADYVLVSDFGDTWEIKK